MAEPQSFCQTVENNNPTLWGGNHPQKGILFYANLNGVLPECAAFTDFYRLLQNGKVLHLSGKVALSR